LGPERGKWIYVANVFVATGILLISVIAGIAPVIALLSLLPLIIAARAAAYLIQYADQSARLVMPIKLTIASALLHGLTLATILAYVAPVR
jgi:1,4-dihydroxy-2-naphthoate octaprenyltransferase